MNVAYTAAYCAAVLLTILVMVPPLRMRLEIEARRAGQTWRYGRWLARQPQPPRFLAHLARPDLPDEGV